MNWLLEARVALLDLLNSSNAVAEAEAAAQLRQAGVRETRIAALYPPDPFDHLQTIGMLLQDDEFMEQVTQPAKKVALPVLMGFLPGQDSQELLMLVENTWSPDGVEHYRMKLAGRKSAPLTLFADAGERTMTEAIERGEVVRTLLSLPLALETFARVQLDPSPWRGDTRLHFHHYLAKTRPEVFSIIDLIRAHQPAAKEPDIEGIIAYLAQQA